jgi:hypothetical protein
MPAKAPDVPGPAARTSRLNWHSTQEPRLAHVRVNASSADGHPRRHGLSREQIRERAATSRANQGLPVRVEDPATLRVVATLVRAAYPATDKSGAA